MRDVPSSGHADPDAKAPTNGKGSEFPHECGAHLRLCGPLRGLRASFPLATPGSRSGLNPQSQLRGPAAELVHARTLKRGRLDAESKSTMPVNRVVFYLRLFLLSVLLFISITSKAQTVTVGQAVVKSAAQSRLTDRGTLPFHFKAVTHPANSFIPDYTAEIEEYWVAPDKWRRTIRAKTFEQTIIVNGPNRFEHSSSDYYPKWLNDIVIALVGVVPDHLISDIGKLPDTVESGRSVVVKYQPSSTDGKVVNQWWGTVELGSTGMLTFISGKYFSAGYDNYTRFHGKVVAQTVETFPPIEHGDVLTHVDLSDFSPVDDSLFAIESPTPAKDQIRVVSLDEIEYRKLAVDEPQMKWAPVPRRPTSGVLSLYIVTDKAGSVREAEFITSNNMELRASAEELVRQWRFKPTYTDGIPAEVETTMTFAFDTTVEGDQAKYRAASYYFKRARDLTYPRTDGSPAFHLIGTFSWTDGSSTRRGKYEEFWSAPNRWRREVTIGETKMVETRIDDDHYRSPVTQPMAPLVTRVISLFTAEFPGYAYYSPDWDWRMDEVTLGNKPYLRVSMGPTENLSAGQYPRAYYFDSVGLVLARSQSRDLISYSDFKTWAAKQVPRHVTLTVGGQVALEAEVELIESAADKDDQFFIIPGIKPRDWFGPAPW
jgi:Gram-negative bacterial TonB protein C-terminal